MTAAVLDASALLALILGEPGGDKVQRLLTDCAVTAVNLGEVIGHFAGIGASEADIRLVLDPCRSFVSPLTGSWRSSPA